MKSKILNKLIEGAKDEILKKVTCQLVNSGRNRESLKLMPHKNVLDLAAVYRIEVGEKGEGDAFTLDYELCRHYGISMEELNAAAIDNTKKEGFKVRAIASVLSEISGIPKEILPDNGVSMHILTNKRKLNGACVMMLGELAETVKKVNAERVDREEFLSNSVYKYDWEDGKLRIAHNDIMEVKPCLV